MAALGGYYFLNSSGSADPSKQTEAMRSPGAPPPRHEEQTIPQTTATPSTVFKGGEQGFIPLKLESVEVLNHNTKKFRFELPDKESVSGLHVACTSALHTVR